MKWEYKVVEERTFNKENLDLLGQDDWELVTMLYDDSEDDIAFFKRPIVETPAIEPVTTDVVHGVDCKKVWHEDDIPYNHDTDYDGVFYADLNGLGDKRCGRCHMRLSEE